MKKIVNTSIDHFGIGCSNPMRATEITRELGFVAGDLPTDILQHFMLDNCYFEFCGNGFDVYFPNVGLAKTATTDIGIGSILLNANDADAARQSYMDAGYEVTPCYVANRWAKHGLRQGRAYFKAFLIRNFGPYKTNRVFGHSVHLTPELIFPEQRFMHVNNVCEIETIYFVTNDVENVAVEMEKFDEITKKHTIPGQYIRFATLVDSEEYKEEFGVDVESNDEIEGVAIVFTGSDITYIKANADYYGHPNFYKDGKLYVDVRKEIGLFYIFK